MKDILRPILELSVVLPGLLLAYFPVKSYLKQSPGKLAARILPLMAGLCIGAGIICYQLHASTASALAGITLLAIGLYTGTLQISLWKSGTIALTVCAVFACINSLSRAISVMMLCICSCHRTNRGSALQPVYFIMLFAGFWCWLRSIRQPMQCV